MSFSLKTLLGSVALVAVLLVASKKLHDQYYIAKLNRFVESVLVQREMEFWLAGVSELNVGWLFSAC